MFKVIFSRKEIDFDEKFLEICWNDSNIRGQNLQFLIKFWSMRKRFDTQLSLSQTPIEKVIIPLRSRDELPPTLASLKWIFTTPEINEEVFELLERKISAGKKHTGRPGMDYWQI